MASFAQVIQVRGTVADAEKGSAVPNINIFLKDTRIGTVSGQSGSFAINLPSTYGDRFLYFSGVGYRTDSLLIRNIQMPVDIRLQPETYRLTEVYVIPDSTLLTLLRRAYNKIPDNYPTVPTQYEGFYRESIQNEKWEQVDFIEAILSVYKDPYNKPTDNPGQIELLKSRKKQLHDIGVIYAGGPFLIINSDYVLKRHPVLSPRHFKQYLYEFNGIVTFKGEEFYKISFSPADRDRSDIQGYMLLEKESLAYASFVVARSRNNSLRMKNGRTEWTITYEKQNGKWYFSHLAYALQHEDAADNDKARYGFVEYITTGILPGDEVSPIPFERRLTLLEPPILKAEEFSPEGWTDYDILQNMEKKKTNFQFSTNESMEIFNQKPSATAEMRKIPFSFISKLNMSIGVSTYGIQAGKEYCSMAFQPNTDTPPFIIGKRIKQEQRPYRFLVTGSIGYRMNKNTNIVWRFTNPSFVKNKQFSENGIGIEYRKNIRPTGHPFFIEGSLALTANSFYNDLGKYDNHATFRYGGKKIDANKLSFDYGVQQKILTPALSLSKKTSRFFEVKLSIGYNINLHSKNVFRIKEEKGNLFTKKKITLPADDPSLQFDDNNSKPWDSFIINKWQVGLSLVFN
jgi:hypothetical protein